MKSVGVIIREKISGDLKDQIKKSEACFFISFNKLAAFKLNVIRNNLKGANTNVFVAKNTLFNKVFAEIGFGELNGLLSGETALVVVHDKDIVKAAKALVDFNKENEALQIRGGFLKDKKLTSENLNALAKLPTKEVLLGMAVSGIAAPLTGFLSTLNQVVVQLLWTLDEVGKTKDKK